MKTLGVVTFVAIVCVAAFSLSVGIDWGLWNLLIAPAFGLPLASFTQAVAGTAVLWFVSHFVRGMGKAKK